MSQWHSSTVSDMSQLFTVPCHSAGRSQQNSLNVLYDAIYQVCVCHVTVPHIGSIFGIGSPLYRYVAFAYQCRVFAAFGLTSFLVGIVFCRMANWRSTTTLLHAFAMRS